ncbi:MAG: DJ-1/PfpI family protein [Candidatus Hodarchaeota archaeon]
MNKKVKAILVGFFILTFIVQLGWFLTLEKRINDSNQGMSIRGARIIIFTADGYSDDDFQGVKQYLDQWRGIVTIVGMKEQVISEKGLTLNSDILFTDIEDITVYDAIFIPGGQLASVVISNQYSLDFFNTAFDNGLVIAAIGEGTLIQAATGLINDKRFTTSSSIVENLTNAGGVFVEGEAVVTDGNIITACPPNYQELSYAIANTLGYTYDLDADISFIKETEGWNYSIAVEPSDKVIIHKMTINLTRTIDNNENTLIATIDLIDIDDSGVYTGNLGILENGYYYINIEVENIYGKVEIRTNIKEFSVGGN